MFQKCYTQKAESRSNYFDNRLLLFIAFCSILFKIFCQLRETAARYKERTRILTFGKSYEGRQLYAESEG